MATPALHVPPPRPAAVRASTQVLAIEAMLPRPIHYALAGGGAHGCVQWGLLQALAETDLTPDALIGTSAGALTGAIVAEDLISSVSRLSYVWSQLDLAAIVGESWLTLARAAATRGRKGLADNAAESDAINSILRARTFEELDVPFAAVATDLATGLAVAHESGPLVAALLASSAIPGILPPVEIDGRLYVDGLASANLPAFLAVQRGAGSVVVLDTGTRKPSAMSTSAPKVTSRVSQILTSSQRRAQLSAAARHVPVVLIPTPDDLGGALDFSGTVRAAADSYELAQSFLQDLAALAPAVTGPKLPPGLYARPDLSLADTDIANVLRPIARPEVSDTGAALAAEAEK